MKSKIELQEQDINELITALNLLYGLDKNQKYTFEVICTADCTYVDAVDIDLNHYRLDTLPGEPLIVFPKVINVLKELLTEFKSAKGAAPLKEYTKPTIQDSLYKETIREANKETKQIEKDVYKVADIQKEKGFEINEAFLSDFNKMWKEATKDIFVKVEEPELKTSKTNEQSLFESLISMLQEIENVNFTQEEEMIPESAILSDKVVTSESEYNPEVRIKQGFVAQPIIGLPHNLESFKNTIEDFKYGGESNIKITTPHEKPNLEVEQDLEIQNPILSPFQQWIEDGKNLLVEKGDILMKEADKIKDLYTILIHIND
jgi:hypothetical protein